MRMVLKFSRTVFPDTPPGILQGRTQFHREDSAWFSLIRVPWLECTYVVCVCVFKWFKIGLPTDVWTHLCPDTRVKVTRCYIHFRRLQLFFPTLVLYCMTWQCGVWGVRSLSCKPQGDLLKYFLLWTYTCSSWTNSNKKCKPQAQFYSLEVIAGNLLVFPSRCFSFVDKRRICTENT